MNHEFKLGDEVECIDNTDVEEYLIKGAMYKVEAVSKDHVQIKVRGTEYSFYNHRFKKKEQSMDKVFNIGDEVAVTSQDSLGVNTGDIGMVVSFITGTNQIRLRMYKDSTELNFRPEDIVHFKKQDTLEELVKKANEGWIALSKLNGNRRQIEYKSTGRYDKEEWVPLMGFEHLVTFRIKPKPQMAPFKLKDSGHEVSLCPGSKTLSIGCVTTTPESAKKVFTALSNGESAQVLAGANLILSPTRKHVECNKGSITWADVDQLLLELNKIEGDKV